MNNSCFPLYKGPNQHRSVHMPPQQMISTPLIIWLSYQIITREWEMSSAFIGRNGGADVLFYRLQRAVIQYSLQTVSASIAYNIVYCVTEFKGMNLVCGIYCSSQRYVFFWRSLSAPQCKHSPLWQLITSPHSGQRHFASSFSRNRSIPCSLMNSRFSIMLM